MIENNVINRIPQGLQDVKILNIYKKNIVMD